MLGSTSALGLGLALLAVPAGASASQVSFFFGPGNNCDGDVDFRAALCGPLEVVDAEPPLAPDPCEITASGTCIDINLLLPDGTKHSDAPGFSNFPDHAPCFVGSNLHTPGSGNPASRMEFVFADPVEGFGAYVFDDSNCCEEGFRMHAEDASGGMHVSPIFDSGNGTSHALEGFVGVVSKLGLRRVSIEKMYLDDKLPSPRSFGVDHLEVGARVVSLPTTYCTAKTNSCATAAVLCFNGSSSASSTSGFDILGSNANFDKAGYLLYTDNGRNNIPFQGGTLCVAGPIRRTIIVGSTGGSVGNCDSQFSIDMNAFASGNLGGNPQAFLLVPGQQVNVQYWGRDSVANGSYLTGGGEYDVGL